MLLYVGDNNLVRATRDVRSKYTNLQFFNARWVLIVTWHNATFFGASVTPFPVYKNFSRKHIMLHSTVLISEYTM